MSRNARPLLASTAILLALGLAALAQPAFAQAGRSAGSAEEVGVNGVLELEVRKGRVMRLQRPAAAVFVADPEIADVQAHSPTLIYLFGKRAGTTTVYAVDENEQVLLREDIVVGHNLSGLNAALEAVAPDSNLDVRSIDGGLILEGTVHSPAVASDLKDIATRFLGPEESLINRLQVDLPTQVNLRVRVAEMSREVTKIFGVNLENAFSIGDLAFGMGSGRAFQAATGGFSRLTDQNGSANALFGSFSNGDVTVDGIVDALEREGLVSVLAEPNLTALSGETASFLAGGEFPVPVGRDDNEIKIEFKEFGVRLSFTPTVLSRDRISLRVRPEVSDLSDNGSIQLGDLVIPALSTRRADTTVELGSAQSFAIGGLISNTTRNNVEKFPGLGDLPILGTLFRSSNFQRSESELVIIVTPYLVRPVHTSQLATPVDGFRAPTDLERILEGRLMRTSERPGKGAPAIAGGGRLLGPAGFMID